MRILMHCESNPIIGSDSVLHTAAMVEELTARGHECVLLSKAFPSWLDDVFGALPVKKVGVDPKCHWDEDLLFFKEVIEDEHIDWIWMDRPDLVESQLRQVRKIRPLASVTPAPMNPDAADLLVGPFLHPAKNGNSNRLGGHRYIPIRRSVRQARERDFYIAPKMRKILLWTESDPGSAVGSTLRILENAFGENIEITVPLPIDASHRKELEHVAAIAPHRLKIVEPPVDFTELFFDADGFISFPGLRMMEALSLGVPCLIGSIHRSQREEAVRVSKRQAAIYYGSLKCTPSNRVVELLSDLLDAPDKRRELSEKGREFVDGQGAVRLADALERKMKG